MSDDAQRWAPSGGRASRTGLGGRLSYYLLCLAAVLLYLDAFFPISGLNFHLSDIAFVLSLATLLLFPGERRRFLRESLHNPLLWLFAALAGVWSVALAMASFGTIVNQSNWLYECLQLLFIFFILAPVVFYHAGDERRHRALWTLQLWLFVFASVLSLTEYLHITHLVVQSYYRVINPILGVNGFYQFGLLSAFWLQGAIRAFPRARTWVYAGGWVLGFLGVALGGVRMGLVLTALSLLAVIWFYRWQLLQRKMQGVALVLLVGLVASGGAYLAFRALPVFQDREQLNRGGFWSDALRIESARTALREVIAQPPWFGEGMGQFAVLHPEMITVHDVYLQQLFESGILGLAAWMGIWWYMWDGPRRQYRAALARQDPTAAVHWWCCSLAVLGFLVACGAYPLGDARANWMIPLLAVGSRRLWGGEKTASASGAGRAFLGGVMPPMALAGARTGAGHVRD